MLKENKLRYLAILILIILGSYTFVAAAGLSQNLASLVTTFTEEHRQEDLSFRTDRAIPDYKEMEEAANAIIEDYLSFDADLTDTLTLRLLSKTEKLNIPAVTEGRPLSGPGEILLDPAFAGAQWLFSWKSNSGGGQNLYCGGFCIPAPLYLSL